MFKNTTGTFKKIIRALIFIVIIVTFTILLMKTSDSSTIKNIKEFTKEGTRVLYITNHESYDKFPRELLEKYDIKYLYIDSESLSRVEKTKLKNIINSGYLSNIVVVFKDGKVKDAIIHYESDERLISFLQENNIIPKVIEDISGILDSVKEVLELEYAIVYIPYAYDGSIQEQTEILKNISKQYLIDFKTIKAYLLSDEQKEKLNAKLGISYVEDQITIMIKKQSIVGNIRGIKKYSEFLKGFFESKFIDYQDYINYINFENFNKIIDQDTKNIVVIGSDENKYCTELKGILNEISSDYNITINYLNIKNLDDDIAKQISKKLEELSFKEGFSIPLTLILESNKILDYIIGTSSKEYFIEKLSENGIIRQEVSQ